jgi:hypothetical protein
MSWTRICEALEDRWLVMKRSDTALLIGMEVDGRRQKVLVERGARDGAILVVAEIGGSRLISAAEALEYNATAEHGALAVSRGVLVLRSVNRGDAFDVEGALRAAAIEATRLHRLFSRPTLVAELSRAAFAHMAD